MLEEGSEISTYYLSIGTDTSVFTYSATSYSMISTTKTDYLGQAIFHLSV